MPAGAPLTPGTRPARLAFLAELPQREVRRVPETIRGLEAKLTEKEGKENEGEKAE